MNKRQLLLLLAFLASTAARAQWSTSGTTTTTTNSVGVGTVAPASSFQVGPGITKLSVGSASGAGLNYGTSYVGFNAARTGSGWVMDGDGAHNGGGVIYADVLGNMYFAPIPSAGNSAATLADADVKSKTAFMITYTGSVFARGVVVQASGWPDYVFKKGYQFPVLTDVKTYIDQTHHLPEIPSAQQIEKDGVNLGDMNRLLLKKVEELTLYAIENEQKDKERAAAAGRLLASLQRQVDGLKRELAARPSVAKH